MNYSRQRNIVLDIMKNTYDHPTAEEVYALASKKLPGIGIATIYRNLNQLAEAGEIVRIPVEDGKDRFDGQLREHYHMICKECGTLVDLHADSEEIEKLKSMILESFNLNNDELEFAPIVLKGVCDKCDKAKKRRS